MHTGLAGMQHLTGGLRDCLPVDSIGGRQKKRRGGGVRSRLGLSDGEAGVAAQAEAFVVLRNVTLFFTRYMRCGFIVGMAVSKSVYGCMKFEESECA